MTSYPNRSLPIRTWAEQERPREKMLHKGSHTLTEAELLAVLLGSGTRALSAVDLAQQLLGTVNNDLHELARRTVYDLMELRGIGQAKALTIVAALELGRRRQSQRPSKRPVIRSSQDAFDCIGHQLSDLSHEEFWILLLNRANRVIGLEQISQGGTAGTVVDGKVLFRKALLRRASSVILCHNHPSGNLQPSRADIEITQKLKDGGKMIDVLVLDHLIIAEHQYFSFADEGIL
jgi:DNA repair protein RadC